MHYFESQLTSTVKCVREDPFKIVFVGHNRWGDGASTPGLLFFFGLMSLLIAGSRWRFSPGVQETLTLVALAFFAAALIAVVYEKTVTFDLQRKCILIQTLTLFGKRTMIYRCDQLRLHIVDINIRLAEHCGALDLHLPDKNIIRLSVDGSIGISTEKGERLAAATGIPLKKDTTLW